jgi:hypothetical protein
LRAKASNEIIDALATLLPTPGLQDHLRAS